VRTSGNFDQNIEKHRACLAIYIVLELWLIDKSETTCQHVR